MGATRGGGLAAVMPAMPATMRFIQNRECCCWRLFHGPRWLEAPSRTKVSILGLGKGKGLFGNDTKRGQRERAVDMRLVLVVNLYS